MTDFHNAIINNNVLKLRSIDKIDIHNHAVSSCTKSYLTDKGISLADEKINNIQSLINFSRNCLSPLQRDINGLKLLLEGNLKTA